MAKMNTQRATLYDVAKRAGVSYQTVSRVINNRPDVAVATREMILQLMAEMNYQPSKAAQNLAGNQSKTLAFIGYSPTDYGPAQIVNTTEHTIRALGYDFVVVNVPDITQPHLQMAIDSISRWQVDGIVMFAPVMGHQYQQLSTVFGSTPIVQIDATPGAAIPSVIIDQQYGGELIAEHLLTLGHTAICEISGQQNWFGAVARHEGLIQRLHASGIEMVSSLEGEWTAESGYRAARTLLQQHRFTALVVGNDQMALGALAAIEEADLRVPNDISVVGFDDVPDAAYYRPALTTVRQDFELLARTSVEYLVERIQNPKTPLVQRTITPNLIVRRSTAQRE